MKNLVSLVAIATSLFFAVFPIHAQTVSVDVNTTYTHVLYDSNFNYSAGTATATNGNDYFVQYWNMNQAPGGDRSGTASPVQGGTPFGGASLLDSTGTTSGIGYSVAYSWADNIANGNVFTSPTFIGGPLGYAPTGDGNAWLDATGISPSSGPLTLNLAGLSTTDDYTVIAYMANIYFSGPSSVAVVLDGQTQYYIPGSGLTGWVAGSSTLAGTVTSNYVEFNNVTAPTGTLSMVATGTDGEPLLEGFQIIDTSGSSPSVPEPSTVWLGVLGFLGLAVHLRRRRLAQIKVSCPLH